MGYWGTVDVHLSVFLSFFSDEDSIFTVKSGPKYIGHLGTKCY